jgi:hypothetical protein
VAQRNKVPFLVKPHEPQVIIVEGADGKRYEISVRFAILEVADTGVPQATDPTIPTFELKAQMVAETKRVADT